MWSWLLQWHTIGPQKVRHSIQPISNPGYPSGS
jgi:hypothetical protein